MTRLAAPVFAGLIVFLSSSQLFCPMASAALGEKHALASAEKSLSPNAAVINPHGAFSIKESVSKNAKVREFLDREGVVFGVTWKGHTPPDFAELFGNFYSEYKDLNARAASGPRVRGGRSRRQGAHLIVEKFGHMGALRGRAFVPSLIPAGVDSNEIK